MAHQDLMEGHNTPTECLNFLIDRWDGVTIPTIAKEITALIYDDADDDSDEWDESEDTRLLTPDHSKPCPPELMDPKTFLDVIRSEERKSSKDGNNDREHACSVLRNYFLRGSIHDIVNALIESTEDAEEYLS